MGHFPMCVDLQGKTILLVGRGPQTAQKRQKLEAFGGEIRQVDSLCESDLTENVAMVVAGDLSSAESERISRLCHSLRIPVNVVDRPALCSFFFPAVITRGDLTVSVSTGGHAPGAAGYLARQMEKSLPDRTEEILDWLGALRRTLYGTQVPEEARRILREAAKGAFTLGRPLTEEEMQ